MIISTIIIYLIGAFIAFLCIGYTNDLNEKTKDRMRWSAFLVVGSWVILAIFILHGFIEFFSKNNAPYPSLSRFIKFFQKTKKNEN